MKPVSVYNKNITIIRGFWCGDYYCEYLLTDSSESVDKHLKSIDKLINKTDLDIEIDYVEKLGEQSIILCNDEIVRVNADNLLTIDGLQYNWVKVAVIQMSDRQGGYFNKYIIGRTDEEIDNYIKIIKRLCRADEVYREDVVLVLCGGGTQKQLRQIRREVFCVDTQRTRGGKFHRRYLWFLI